MSHSSDDLELYDFSTNVDDPLKMMHQILTRLSFFRTVSGDPNTSGTQYPDGAMIIDRDTGTIYSKVPGGASVPSGDSGHMVAANNLSDVIDAVAALANLNGLNLDNNLSDLADAAIALANLSGLDKTDIVTQGDAEAGTATVAKTWTAERVKQSVLANAPGGGGGDPILTSDPLTPADEEKWYLYTAPTGGTDLPSDGQEVLAGVEWINPGAHTYQNLLDAFNDAVNLPQVYLLINDQAGPLTVNKLDDVQYENGVTDVDALIVAINAFANPIFGANVVQLAAGFVGNEVYGTSSNEEFTIVTVAESGFVAGTAPQQEITEYVFPDEAAGNYDNSYFIHYNPYNAIDGDLCYFYIGADPGGPGLGGAGEVGVAITAAMSGADIATLVEAQFFQWPDINASLSIDQITVTNSSQGIATDSHDNGSGSPIAITVLQQGQDGVAGSNGNMQNTAFFLGEGQIYGERYVWMNVDGAGVNPDPLGNGSQPIEVAVALGDSAGTIGDTLAIAIAADTDNGSGGPAFAVLSNDNNGTLVLQELGGGDVNNAQSYDSPFSVNTTKEGGILGGGQGELTTDAQASALDHKVHKSGRTFISQPYV